MSDRGGRPGLNMLLGSEAAISYGSMIPSLFCLERSFMFLRGFSGRGFARVVLPPTSSAKPSASLRPGRGRPSVHSQWCHPQPTEVCFVFLLLRGQIMTGHEECVQMLLEQEASILCRDSRGRTPLHYAAARGHATWLSELLQIALSEEECCFKDNQGYTPLHWACYNGELHASRVIQLDVPTSPLCNPSGGENVAACCGFRRLCTPDVAFVPLRWF